MVCGCSTGPSPITLNLTMSGMSHASEFIALIVENHWRVIEQPVEIVYTEYSMSRASRCSTASTSSSTVSAREDAPMNWIQVLLIAAVVALLIYLLRSRTNTKAKAWVKVGLPLFVVAAVYAILRPDDTTVVANRLGVARGADLLSYALIIAFVFTTMSTYLRFKELELEVRPIGSAKPRLRCTGTRTSRNLRND